VAVSDAERRLILLSAGTAARRRDMREQGARLMGEVDWAQLADTLRVRRLLPALGPRIVELAPGLASTDFGAAVDEANEVARRRAVFLLLVCQRMMSELRDAGIPSVPLKGPSLGEAIYGDPGRRLSSDIDLLVAPEQLRLAVETVRGLGYAAPTDRVERRGLPMLHFALEHERARLPPVELHWRIHWYERTFARERLLPPCDTLLEGWRPEPADELVALLLFYARDGFVDLRLATDLGAWWDVFGDDLRRGAVDEVLRAYPGIDRAVRVAVRVAEKVVGIPAGHVVADSRPQRLRDKMAVRLASPNPQSSGSQQYADMGFIDGLLMPPGDFTAFVRRQVVLPRGVVSEYSRRSPDFRAKSPLDYGLRVLVRYGLTILRSLRPPETLS
jgi:Uncharacterised nucleotidyltransferase